MYVKDVDLSFRLKKAAPGAQNVTHVPLSAAAER